LFTDYFKMAPPNYIRLQLDEENEEDEHARREVVKNLANGTGTSGVEASPEPEKEPQGDSKPREKLMKLDKL
jgi:hypothetical protein